MSRVHCAAKELHFKTLQAAGRHFRIKLRSGTKNSPAGVRPFNILMEDNKAFSGVSRKAHESQRLNARSATDSASDTVRSRRMEVIRVL